MCFSKDIECSFIVYNPIEFTVDIQENVANDSMFVNTTAHGILWEVPMDVDGAHARNWGKQ